ncbi:IS110 family transposase [Rhizobium indigoferae]|uniref:IS110 family transposase n=1 Tax=Rhizobium indigoferae TaxID=158891 RepID=A0ABZ1DQC0_9HYPH|nr:IS110 family transposase [Rhizobium indigoferae]WRW37760.1 IS110 family transposase [Rhizobium indigoferae]GLR61926.1 IS110 family transposase [Rhizobium indigoferae]
MILNAIAEKLKRQSKDDFKGRHFEAGYDGFWLARFLLNSGIDTTVLDPSSFLVSRRGRRVKTDRIDVEAMVFTLKAYLLGDRSVCRPVWLPSIDEEDAKRLSRERTQLKKERTRHVNRIRALLVLHGIRSVPGLWGGRWKEALSNIRTGDGRELGRFIFRELCRQFERLDLVHSQLKALEKERIQACRSEGEINNGAKIRVLKQLDGIGEIGAAHLVAEVFHRTFKNRKHLASYLGLSPSPYASGEVHRDQGISKAGNKQARVMLIELAWCWLKYQPQSQLTRWYRSRFSGHGSRSGKVGIVALARKLATAFWRFIEDGVVPEGATLSIAAK